MNHTDEKYFLKSFKLRFHFKDNFFIIEILIIIFIFIKS